jgi:hypothetical protein
MKSMHTETVRLSVHEKEFEVTLTEKEGKIFAKTHINNFGEIQVPDLGGGKEKALEGMKARIGNILSALEADEAREVRKRDAAQQPAPAPAASVPEGTAATEQGEPAGQVPEKPELN